MLSTHFFRSGAIMEKISGILSAQIGATGTAGGNEAQS